MYKILCIIGTRPEVIKMAPIILQLQKEPWANVRIVATAQHREMLDQMTKLFNLTPDVDLDIMQSNQTLPNLTARLLTKLDAVLAEEQAQAVIAQGDTTTVFAAALACFYNNIPFYHVEAGLRSYDLRNPFPEEMNRVLAAQLATINFAPTETAKENLVREGITADSIYITGNTIVDALLYVAKKNIPHNLAIDPSKRLVLVTAHRRENFGASLLAICKAIRDLADAVPDIQILYPVHPNPQVTKVAYEVLSNHPRILLSPPLDYVQLVAVLQQAHLVLTDSGGIQEEAPAFGKPVLVLRTNTERPEGVEAGVAELVGTDHDHILAEAINVLTDKSKYLAMAKKICPYGDGYAAKRITEIIRDNFFIKCQKSVVPELQDID